MPVNTPPPGPYPGYTHRGRQLGRGVVDMVDALMVSQYITGKNLANFHPDNADVNHYWVIDSVDSMLIAQYYAGIIPSLPPPGTTPAVVRDAKNYTGAPFLAKVNENPMTVVETNNPALLYRRSLEHP
jgi:hypothetical protein